MLYHVLKHQEDVASRYQVHESIAIAGYIRVVGRGLETHSKRQWIFASTLRLRSWRSTLIHPKFSKTNNHEEYKWQGIQSVLSTRRAGDDAWSGLEVSELSAMR